MEASVEGMREGGPDTVLTNGLLRDPEGCRRRMDMGAASEYSLDRRISMDGYTAEANDPIRGEGTFERILAGVLNAVRAGPNPVITVTEVHAANASRERRQYDQDDSCGKDYQRRLATSG